METALECRYDQRQEKAVDEPSPGDIIFFDWERDGLADHVGIVGKVENGLVYTIEGNTGDVCAERHYTFGLAPIYGYGLPLY